MQAVVTNMVNAGASSNILAQQLANKVDVANLTTINPQIERVVSNLVSLYFCLLSKVQQRPSSHFSPQVVLAAPTAVMPLGARVLLSSGRGPLLHRSSP
eukprot:m.102354 g.102354  ORF g.102354 m.102354 type:complete len:99 (+) comp14116_c0_seq1:305-601(+)